MSHLAAIIPEAKAPLELKEVPTPQPGPQDILIKNELIALHPFDANIAKLAVLPIPYPYVLGNTFAGTVTAVGAEVTNFKVGDRVVANRTPAAGSSDYGGYQRYALARAATTSKVPEGAELSVPATLMGNYPSIVGMFTATEGLERPEVSGEAPSRGKKILIYGGTSSFGSLAVQYVAQAGYTVVTTTSPKHSDFVSKLGAAHVIDHTQDKDALVKALAAEGPYDLVVDCISNQASLPVTGGVVAAQGGGTLHTVLPLFGPSPVPENVTLKFASWPSALFENENAELLSWTYGTYLTEAVANNRLIPLPLRKLDGGLGALNEGLDVLFKGVSGVKVVVNPWE